VSGEEREASVSKAPKVGLLGLLGTGNLGNDVSMESVLRYLRTEHPEAVVDVMGKGPGTIIERYGVPAVFMNWYQRYEKTATGLPAVLLKSLGKVIDVPRMAAWVRRHDVVIIPGMGTMEASLPLKSWQLPYAFFIVGTSAKLFRVKVAFVAIGAGAVKRRATRFLLDSSAKLATYRSYRDAQSRDRLRDRGVDTSRDHVYADLAFGIPPLPCGPGDPNLVCVGIMGYSGGNDDGEQADEIYAAYVSTMKSFVRWLVDNDRTVRVLIGDENQEDVTAGREVFADVQAYCSDLAPERAELVYATTFQELMRVMEPAGTVVASRFHSVVCALRLGKPVVALSYAPKFASLLTNMGLGEFWQSAKFPDLDVLITQFTEMEKRQDELRKAIVEGNANYEQSVADQFAELSVLLRVLTLRISRPVPRKSCITASSVAI
jgi:polysaccharide pyruvyl transferase WcaK-like protein